MNWLRRLFAKKDKFPGIEYPIREAFTIKGRTFYEMDDLMNAPYERGVTCLTYYAEFNQRVDRDYLLKHVEAVDKLLELTPNKPVDLYKVKQLNTNLKDRLTWLMDADLAYKLASVVFFDKNENPAVYDFKYNQEKIAFWKKEMAAKEFFFMLPLQKLIPFLSDYEENLDSYLKVTEQIKGHYQQNILQVLSAN